MKPWLYRAGIGLALLIGGIVIVEEASRGAPGIQRPLETPLAAKAGATLMHRPEPPLDPTALAARILSRPLFVPGRRPFTAAAAEAAPDAGPAELRLVGIVFFSGARRALMAVSGSDKAVLIGPGGRIAGRTVREIDKNRILLSGPEGGAETITMMPMKSSSDAPSRPNAPTQ